MSRGLCRGFCDLGLLVSIALLMRCDFAIVRDKGIDGYKCQEDIPLEARSLTKGVF